MGVKMSLAIIDGDVLCHLACAPRWEDRAKVEDGKTYIELDEDGNRKLLEFTADEDNLYLQRSWKGFKQKLNSLLDDIFCTEFVMAVQGEDNYRKVLYPEYKANRHKDPRKQNKFVPIIRHFAVEEGYAIWSEGREADDFVRIWAEEARSAGDDFVICSVDKDLLCIPGKHYRMRDHELIEVKPSEGLKHYYEQLIAGDTGDYIPGVPGIGPKTAKELLIGLSTEEEFQECVIAQYLGYFGDDWRNALLSNGKMIHIQRRIDDYFSLKNWPLAEELGYNWTPIHSEECEIVEKVVESPPIPSINPISAKSIKI
jgi:hypothetical protein